MKAFAGSLTVAMGLAGVLGLGGNEARTTRTVYIGTYTGETSKGIYAFQFDDVSGTLTAKGLAAEATSPSFLTASTDGRSLFAVNETSTFNGEAGGSVSSFAVSATGTLTRVSVQPTHGADPCHLMLDRTGRYLAVANYTGGNFALFPVGADGRLAPATTIFQGHGSGPNAERQEGPHAHEVVFDAANHYLIGADLGIDRLLIYRFDAAAGTVAPNTPADIALPPGAGPRHFVFHPNGQWAFSINELASTITTFTWDAGSGTLRTGPSVSTLPTGFSGTNTTAEIAVHPNGRFLYGSNRGDDSIAVFRIGTNGTLSLLAHTSTRGKTPRHFAIDPSGRWLLAANQDSGTLAVFRVDPATGTLAPVGPLVPVGSPVNVLFMAK